ncbi:MAG: ABC transporter ATP-binding protein [bacterium]|nr:ABC transporter ATP-binding protein [bacterium]
MDADPDGPNAERLPSTREVVRHVVGLCRPHLRTFAWIALLAALSSLAEVGAPLVYRSAVNDLSGLFVHRAASVSLTPEEMAEATRQPHTRGHVAPRHPQQVVVLLLEAVALLFLLKTAAQFFFYAADNASVRVADGVEKRLVLATFLALLRRPLAFFALRPSGALVKQVAQIDAVSPIVGALARDLLPTAFQVALTVGVMLTVHPRLTAIALATIPAYAWVSWRMVRRLEAGLDDYYELWETATARVQDAVGGIKTVKLAGAEGREGRRLASALDTAYRQHVDRNVAENRYLMAQAALTYAGQTLVLGYGGLQVMAHALTPGDVVMFVVYLDRLLDPVQELSRLVNTLQQDMASVARALRLQRHGGAESGGGALAPGPGRVELRDVRFSYVPGCEVLRGLSFTIEPGLTTALVGPSGSGKTTTVDLLLRLYEPDAGAIVVDGQPLREVDAAAVRAAIAVVSTDGALFRGTIADNVRYDRPDASDAEVREVVRIAGLEAALARLGDGLDAPIGEGGIGLSVGERQRLLLARALLARPRLLVLDEATANLDFATEADVKQALLEQRHGRTMLVIAHRFAMVEPAERVLVPPRGRVAETGTVDELRRGDGWFARFARSAGGHGP